MISSNVQLVCGGELYEFDKFHALTVILSVLAKDLASNGKARSFASTLRMTGPADQS